MLESLWIMTLKIYNIKELLFYKIVILGRYDVSAVGRAVSGERSSQSVRRISLRKTIDGRHTRPNGKVNFFVSFLFKLR